MSTLAPKQPERSIAGRLVFSLIVVAIAAGIFFYRQTIVDQVNVWAFRPSDTVKALATRASLSEQGSYYYFASRPELLARDAFNESCGSAAQGEKTAVLGCYTMQRIYLFDIQDSQLDGIKEVTAAHEMLHAAYERLSASERERIDDLLETESQKITDPTFVDLLKEYEKTEPGERYNELHSLIGTQIASISPELEAYYKTYFKDRSQVVVLYKKYESVFAGLKAKQEALATELDRLSEQISDEVTQYNAEIAQLNRDVEAFNQRAENGSIGTQAAFNAERSRLVARQNALAATRDGLNVTISTFNTKREQLAAINSQADALNRSINSSLDPLPTINES